MHRTVHATLLAVLAFVTACAQSRDDTGSDGCPAAHDAEPAPADATAPDDAVTDAADVAAESDALAPDAPGDAGVIQCAVNGNPGQCMDTTACRALPAFSPVAGVCPGPASVECCVLTPDVANNPPVPAGWTLLRQADVTAEMTAWAVAILHSPAAYPMFSVAIRTFGALTVMARVEWHPPDFQNSAVHRGVTLFHP